VSTTVTRAARLTTVAVNPDSKAGLYYRASRQRAARTVGFPPEPGLNLRFFGGKTIKHLTFAHRYLGGAGSWSRDDVELIDWALPTAMKDRRLNNVLAQYYDGDPRSEFGGSRFLEGPVPKRIFRDTIERIVSVTDTTGFDLASTVFCFFLPRGVVLVDGDGGSQAHRDEDEDEPRFNPALGELDEAADSEHGLGGYHGSIHRTRGSERETVYYAVGVYDEGANGIALFPEAWKNICAVFYHELVEARTDPDIEDAIRAGDTPGADRFLGWYSPEGGEIGDIPLDRANDLSRVMVEVKLTGSNRTVPVQLMWSNAVGGPEGPIATKHRRAA
jgi:hypothetical protein